MKKLNNKGYMLIEIIVASFLSLVIAYFLINVTIKLVNKNNDYYVDSEILADKTIITKEIMDDINSKKLTSVIVENENKVKLIYDDGVEKDLELITNEDKTIIEYGDYKKEISEKLNITEIKIEIIDEEILTISIPAYTNYSQENYGIKITIPYSEDIEISYPNPKDCQGILTKFDKRVGSNLLSSLKNDVPDFSKTSCSSGCEEATVGIYESEDDLGISCYFRGDVTNNYVKFGKDSKDNDMYWKIIRINEDGSIRMIYDGITSRTSEDYQYFIDMELGRFESSMTKFEVGYMYGAYNDETKLFANTYDSGIKVVIDSWYETNIINTGYSGYVNDAIYCNDREIATVEDISSMSNSNDNNVSNNLLLEENSKEEIIPLTVTPPNTQVKFAGYERLVTKKEPTLKCNQQNDRFTVELEVGNKALKYPIAMITKDEIVMAGGAESSYLDIEEEYLTMTTEKFIGKLTMPIVDFGEWNKTGLFMFSALGHYYNSNIRPVDRIVITIDDSAINGGTGAYDDPFVIK